MSKTNGRCKKICKENVVEDYSLENGKIITEGFDVEETPTVEPAENVCTVENWKPLGMNVFVIQDPPIKQIGSIVLPTQAQEKLRTGVVVKIGDTQSDRMCKWTQEHADALMGKRVMWNSFAGETIYEHEDGNLLRVTLDDLICVEEGTHGNE